jgi:hypothetical protein
MFRLEKKSPKHIKIGSSFEDLVATGLTVKKDFQSDKGLELLNILNIRILY